MPAVYRPGIVAVESIDNFIIATAVPVIVKRLKVFSAGGFRQLRQSGLRQNYIFKYIML